MELVKITHIKPVAYLMNQIRVFAELGVAQINYIMVVDLILSIKILFQLVIITPMQTNYYPQQFEVVYMVIMKHISNLLCINTVKQFHGMCFMQLILQHF